MRRFIFISAVAGFTICLALGAFFAQKVRERNRYIEQLIEVSLPDTDYESPAAAAIAVSDAIYRSTNRSLDRADLDWFSRWESTSFFNVTTAVSLRYGGYGIRGHTTVGACGTMSRALLNALWKLDIPARKLQLLDGRGGGHTVVEFKDNGRWLVISPSDSSFVWRKENGKIATALEIKNDPELFSAIYRWKSDFPYSFDNYKNIRWEKLPGGAVNLIRFVIGSRRFDEAKTPKLYDMPRTLFLIASVSLLVLFGVAAYLSRPSRARTRLASRV